MKLLISSGEADAVAVGELVDVLAGVGVELERDHTLMDGTADAGDLRVRLRRLDGWIVALGRPDQDVGWIDRDVVGLLRLGDVPVVPLHLPGFAENPVYSALADRSGIPLADVGPVDVAKTIIRSFDDANSAERVQPLDGPPYYRQLGSTGRHYRVRDDIDVATRIDLSADDRDQLIQALPSAFRTAPDAHALLRRISFPQARMPAFTSAKRFWNEVALDFESGVLADLPFTRLLREAVRVYPANPVLRPLAIRSSLLVAEDRGSGRGTRVLVPLDRATPVEDALQRVHDALRDLGIDPVLGWNTSQFALFDVETALVEDLKSRLSAVPTLEDALVLPPDAPDYLIASLVVQGPDKRRFRMSDVPAATTGAGLLGDLGEAVPEIGNDPRATLEREYAEGQPTSLDPFTTLHDAGVEDGDELRVTYQTRAGCFTADTRILMADGSSRSISSLRAGDRVATSSRHRDRLASASVLGVLHYERAHCMTINRRLTLTPSHPLLVNNAWAQAGDVRLGDHLAGFDGAPVVVTSLESQSADQSVHCPVLPPENEGFFVDGLLVMNMTDAEVNATFGRSLSDPGQLALAASQLSLRKASWP